MDIMVFGISGIVLVKIAVEILKGYNLVEKLWLPAALAIGVLLSVLNKLATMYPAVAEWYKVIFVGLAVGLAASELYDLQKSLRTLAKNGNKAITIIEGAPEK